MPQTTHITAQRLFEKTLINRVSFQDKLLLTKHLSVMLKSGIPLAEALFTLIEQAKAPQLRRVLQHVLADIENGQSLSHAFERHPKVFSQLYVNLVAIGEESGTLEQNIDFLATQLTKEYNLRKKISGALLYPAVVLSAMVIMGSVIALFILPKLVDFFDAFEVELPATTRLLVFVAQLMKEQGVWIIAGALALLIAVVFFVRIRVVQPLWHRFILRIPVLGTFLLYGELAHFSRNFGSLLKSGVPIHHSIEVTAQTLHNTVFRADLERIAQELNRGKNISTAMVENHFFEFPPLVSRMIGVGEKTGKLEDTLLYLGDFYEEEIDSWTKNFTTILEPVLLIVIGIAVAFIALAIISPIYQLTGSIR